MKFGEIENVFEFGILQIYTSFKNFKVSQATFDKDLTEVKLNSSEPNIIIALQKGGFHLSFDYHIKTEPDLLDDAGSGDAFFEGLSFNIKANPKERDGRFQVNFDTVDIDCDNFGLVTKGGDLSVIVNNFSDLIQEFVRKYLLGELNNETRNAVESIINDLLLDVPTKVIVEDGELEIDYALVGDGIVI